MRLALITGLGLKQGLSMEAGIKTWETLIRPILEYGIEIWGSSSIWKEAEAIQIQMGRALLGVSPNVANDAIRGDLGWWTMKGRSDLAKLRLWGKILNTDHSHLLFQVYKTRRAEYTQFNYIKSWCHDIHQLLVKLGLGTCWDTEEVGTMKTG